MRPISVTCSTDIGVIGYKLLLLVEMVDVTGKRQLPVVASAIHPRDPTQRRVDALS